MSEHPEPQWLDLDAVRAALVPLPMPGSGRTLDRWRGLAALGRADLCLAKLVEPHHDATAILAELGGPSQTAGDVWAVWAAEPPGSVLKAAAGRDGWRLDGSKPFCSGGGLVTSALVTAAADGESGLFAVDLTEQRDRQRRIEVGPSAWVGPGMRRADTRTLTFHDVPAEPVGGLGGYTARPGFWHGSIGVAACWYGGADAIAQTLRSTAERRDLNPHALAHLGAVTSVLDRSWAHLSSAAEQIDSWGRATSAGAEPERVDLARRLAESVRATVVDAVEQVVARVGRALGPAPLAFDAAHAHRVSDLQTFVRQHHAETDLAALGALVSKAERR
ncbi:MAG: acyl-CoA dehydrogenase [Nocardioidaceae bacterium]